MTVHLVADGPLPAWRPNTAKQRNCAKSTPKSLETRVLVSDRDQWLTATTKPLDLGQMSRRGETL